MCTWSGKTPPASPTSASPSLWMARADRAAASQRRLACGTVGNQNGRMFISTAPVRPLLLSSEDRPCSEYIRSRGEGQGGLIGRQQGSSVETLRNLQLSNAGHSRPPPACKPTVISACWTALETPLTSHNTQHVFMPRLTADARAALHILIIESDHRLQVPV